MASNAIAALGTTLKMGNTVISEVISIKPPNPQTDKLDVTHLGSTGGYRDKKPSWKDAGEASFDINYMPQDATHKALLANYASGATVVWTVTYPDGSSTTYWSGYVSGFEPSIETDSQLKATVTITVTGPVTYPS